MKTLKKQVMRNYNRLNIDIVTPLGIVNPSDILEHVDGQKLQMWLSNLIDGKDMDLLEELADADGEAVYYDYISDHATPTEIDAFLRAVSKLELYADYSAKDVESYNQEIAIADFNKMAIPLMDNITMANLKQFVADEKIDFTIVNRDSFEWENGEGDLADFIGTLSKLQFSKLYAMATVNFVEGGINRRLRSEIRDMQQVINTQESTIELLTSEVESKQLKEVA